MSDEFSKGWKNPQRYEDLLHIAGQLGVPGAAEADAVNQQIHPVDLLIGILGQLHKKTTKRNKNEIIKA